LTNAQRIRDSLTDATERRLSQKLSDPASFGMAKSFFMMGHKAGFDMTTQEGLDAFQAVYNSSLLNGPVGGLPLGPEFEDGDLAFDPGPGVPGLTKQEREKKRKARKAQRQARKRNRK
jgi:hypothetical protein